MMRIDYATLGARARGLLAHLCARDELERYTALPDTGSLAAALRARSPAFAALPDGAGAADIDRAVRDEASQGLRVLARWGPDNPVLEAFQAEQERRSLRALVRGAAEGARVEQRLAGLLPTPRLPAAMLAELARAATPREVALRLLMLGDAHAQALVALTAPRRVDLFEVDLALARVLAARWRDAAARGDAALRETLAERIDLANVQAALTFAGTAPELPLVQVFVAGGRRLQRDAFVAAAGAVTRDAAATLLAPAFAGTPLAPLFAMAVGRPQQVDAAALGHWIDALRRTARTDPLGSAPAQLYLARLEAQCRDLRRIAWGLQLGATQEALRSQLVTPWH